MEEIISRRSFLKLTGVAVATYTLGDTLNPVKAGASKQLSSGIATKNKEIFYVEAKDCKLYCEKRGKGPLVVIAPDGSNDCELYAKLADMMADEFTVVSFDPRGGSRSLPTVDQKVTPEMFAEDLAAIIKHMDMGKASIIGCSSGGQGVLMTGVKHSELIKNIIVHEAALQKDAQFPSTGYDYFSIFSKTYGPYMTGRNVSPPSAMMYFNVCPDRDFDDELCNRLAKNSAYWMKYYLGTVDAHSYSKEELARIPACDFTVGTWTSAWLPYANIETAKRGGFSYTWVPASHLPAVSCPELYADFCKKTIHQYD